MPAGRRAQEAQVRVLSLHGNRGKCPEPYTRQEILSGAFANVLQELVIPPAILDWLGDAVLNWDRTEQAARAETIKKLQARRGQIEARIETMYMDKLDGRITQDFFDKQAAMWHKEQDGLLRKIQDIRKATPAPVDQAIDMLRLTSRASGAYSGRWWKRPHGKAACCRQRCSNRLKSCAIRTGKVIERKRRKRGQDRIWKSGSSGRTRTYNPSVNSRTACSRLMLQMRDLGAQDVADT